jgi:hypothetical protein
MIWRDRTCHFATDSDGVDGMTPVDKSRIESRFEKTGIFLHVVPVFTKPNSGDDEETSAKLVERRNIFGSAPHGTVFAAVMR